MLFGEKILNHINGVKYNLVSFINKNDAIIARLRAEKKYFGEFSPQQALFEQYGINIEEAQEANDASES